MKFLHQQKISAETFTGRAKLSVTQLIALLFLILPMLFMGCSGGDVPATSSSGTSTTTTSSGGYTLYLSLSKTSIITDNIDSVDITATLVKDNVAQIDETVIFSSTDGLLSSNSATTDANGEAKITFKSGPGASNQVVNIGATSNGAATNIPVQITGNDLQFTQLANIAVSSSEILTATLTNAADIAIANTTVSFEIDPSSPPGVISLSSLTSITDVNGEATINLTGLAPGTVRINAVGLGATAMIDVTVANAAQVFEITSPTIDPASLETNTGSLVVSVNAPGLTSVDFYTSIGVWNGLSKNESIAVVGGVASATLTSTQAGTASITVNDPIGSAQDTLLVEIYAPATEATNITLQASKTNVSITPIGSTSSNTVLLTALVTNGSGYAVGGAVVNFSLSNTSGGGEYLSPGIAFTDSSGVARTTFYSGSRGSGSGGVTVTASVGTLISASEQIIITDLATSIAMGIANKIVIVSNTTYSQDITVQVNNANGSPVKFTNVSLNLRPTGFLLGGPTFDASFACTGYAPDPECATTPVNYIQPAEDVNGNFFLDPGEDTGPLNNSGVWAPDGFLTPPNSSAGVVPATVTTDELGMATFQITYLKRYGMWVQVTLTATVQVSGSETYADMTWVLNVEENEHDSCNLFSSPFGYTGGSCYTP